MLVSNIGSSYLYWDGRAKVEAKRMYFSCLSCGKKVEYHQGEPPCEVLKDWLTVSRWKGSGSVEHHNFCSFSCLKSWVDVQVPAVPKAFLDPFKEGES
jgi:hypothetical protein